MPPIPTCACVQGQPPFDRLTSIFCVLSEIQNQGTGGSQAAALAAAAEGQVYGGLFMNTFGAIGTLAAWSRDGVDWTIYCDEEGDPVNVFTPPAGITIARDPEPIYDPVNNRWLMFYTAVDAASEAPSFGIAESTNLTGPYTHVQLVSIAGMLTLYGPSAFIDDNGELKIFIGASPLPGSNPAMFGSMGIYVLGPTASWDVAGTWSAATQLDMPGSDVGWNEVRVQRLEDGNIRMLINALVANTGYKVLQPSNPAVLGGTWTQTADIGSVIYSGREGAFFFELPRGGYRVFTTHAAGAPTSYSYCDFDSSWVKIVDITTCGIFPSIEMEHGTAVLISSKEAAVLGSVSLRGGQINSKAQIQAVGFSAGANFWEQGSGFGWRAPGGTDGKGTYVSSIVMDSGSKLYWRLPAGESWYLYNSGGTVPLMHVNGSTGAAKFYQNLIIGASGTATSNVIHGTAVLVNGTVSVANANVVDTGTPATSSRIFVNRAVDGGTIGDSYSVVKTNGVSFSITSKTANVTQALDTSTVSYVIYNP